ncbi:hypothetical protein O3P69_019235 [Scylla paramamosain]|uniref:Fibronectin type-III domain-containing protein n=1 Tax=Scylla paramamosain TaxID=85552 RepID=A0AAW0SVZ9_SCYPA
MELAHNVSAGVIQSNQSLVLQKVGRVSSGLYTCKAINLHGTGSSNAVQLSVKYAPVCAGGQKRVYGGGRFHTMNITCRVESHPEATSFRWAFNTSTEFSPVGGASVSPGVPETVQNCSAWQSHTNTSNEPVVIVSCVPGWGGGLQQTFSLEVRSGKGDATPLAALTDQRAPQFTVTGLQSGEVYQFTVLASNVQGESGPVSLEFGMPLDVAEKRMRLEGVGVAGVDDSYPHPHAKLVVFSPLVGAAVGLLAAILLCSLMAILVVKSRTAHAHAHAHGHAHTHKTLYDPPTPDEDLMDDGHDPKPPMTHSHAHSRPQEPDVTRVRPAGGPQGDVTQGPGIHPLHPPHQNPSSLPRTFQSLPKQTHSNFQISNNLSPSVRESYPIFSLRRGAVTDLLVLVRVPEVRVVHCVPEGDPPGLPPPYPTPPPPTAPPCPPAAPREGLKTPRDTTAPVATPV